MPRITRSTPASSARRIAFSERSPPPYCTGRPSSRTMRSGVAQVGRLALAGAVEVHHVKSAGAGHAEVAGGLHRILAVHGLAREVALLQAHGPAVADVHRRQEDHAAHRRAKLPSSASPSGPDFSGWNCTPYTGGRATTLANSPP